MIIDLYAPTRGTDSLTATCVTDSPAPVRLRVRGDGVEHTLEAASVGPDEEGLWFRRFAVDGLAPGQVVSLTARPRAGEPRRTWTSTLPCPSGRRRLRFGIVADPHVTRDRESGARLHRQSFDLLTSSLQLLARRGAAFVVIPGDLTDAGTADQIEEAERVLRASPVPCRLLIGNRDGERRRFLEAFGLGRGYASFAHEGVRFICLHTPDAGGLHGEQLAWLQTELAAHPGQDALLFSHYPLVAHPYLYRQPDDDRHLDHPQQVGDLLRRHPRVRAAFAGHKNIPCRTDRDGIAHLLCPQPVHYPCSVDLVDVYPGGLVRRLLEIDDLPLVWRSRRAHADLSQAAFRYGLEEGRNVSVRWDVPGDARVGSWKAVLAP